MVRRVTGRATQRLSTWWGHPPASLAVLVGVALLAATVAGQSSSAGAQPPSSKDVPVRLAGGVPPAVDLPGLTAVTPAASEASQPLTVTVTLNRTDEAGFQRFLNDVENPKSPSYRHFLTQAQLASRFGPSRQAYDTVVSWLGSRGLKLVQGSANRLTITVKGTRAQAEQAFGVGIRDYRVGTRTFYANDISPALPSSVAASVESVSGLSDLGTPAQPAGAAKGAELSKDQATRFCQDFVLPVTYFSSANLIDVLTAVLLLIAGVIGGWAIGGAIFFASVAVCFAMFQLAGTTPGFCLSSIAVGHGFNAACSKLFSGLGLGPTFAALRTAAAPPTTQKIGLAEFDTFTTSDTTSWLNLIGANATIGTRVTKVDVNGGVPTPGAGESEVLIDVDAAMMFDPLPGDQYVVYDAPATTSYQQLFNAMIGDGDTVISNSWSQCEDQTSLADAQSIDSVLAQAAAAGISVFNGSGDTGTTCLDGKPNTVGVPADSPHATAVGGTSMTLGPALTYGHETWWDGSAGTPPGGQGGYGVSNYFTRPAYQNGFTSAAGRSVPDVATLADPHTGIEICQADNGGCPNGLAYGGTSLAAPEWAAMTAALNHVTGTNIGQANPVLYALSATAPAAFHPATGMGTDFAHVGLGSPNFGNLLAALEHATPGAVDATLSSAGGLGHTPADGQSAGLVRVDLVDANGFGVAGKTVSITPNPGSHAVVSPASGPSTVDGGDVTFNVTDATVETVTFTVTDTTDNLVLSASPQMAFVAPTAAGAAISAAPTAVPNDGTSASTIGVYLEDAKGRPAVGKTVLLAQGTGTNAVVSPAVTAITDSTGTATFTATDAFQQTVTFNAVDVTDGNLPVPGNAVVNFAPGATATCGTALPVPSSGYAVSPFSTGFAANQQPIVSSIGLTFTRGACAGPREPAFDASGNAYVADLISGTINVIAPGGGPATSANQLPGAQFAPGQLTALAFGKDGSLYGGLLYTNGSAFQPAIVQLDPATGTTIRTIATAAQGLADCPDWLATDPLSGDLFAVDECFGSVASTQITRISNPASATPTVSDYVNTPPGVPTSLAFAPNGTLYVPVFTNPGSTILAIGGTNTVTSGGTPTVTSVATTTQYSGIAVAATNPAGAATSLYTNSDNSIAQIDLPAATSTDVFTGPGANRAFIVGNPGPNGCLLGDYVSTTDGQLLQFSPPSGPCAAAPPGPTLSLTRTGTGNPAAGSTVSLTAALTNVANPGGIPIRLVVAGANGREQLVNTTTGGTASFSYSGVFQGSDNVEAVANVGGTVLTSAPIAFRWLAGTDTSFVTLNGSQEIGAVGQPATITATLADISQDPPTPVSGATIQAQLGAASCMITTGATGVGSCQATPSGGGVLAVSATYAGSFTLTPSSATSSFFAGGPSTAPPASAPAFTALSPPLTATTGVPYSYTFAASGSPAPTFALAPGAPSWLTVNSATGVVSGTPPAGTTTFTYSVLVSNGVSPDATAGPFAVSVTPATIAPAFTALSPPFTATAGVLYSYTFAASGSPAPTFALAPGAPSWLTVNSATGVVSGTPPVGTTTFAYSVLASNGVSPDATVGPFSVAVQSVGGGTQASVIDLDLSKTSTYPGTVVTLTAEVSSKHHSKARPTGNVAFTDNGTPISGCTAVNIAAGGKAVCHVSYATADGSPHHIIVTYSGDGTYAPSVDTGTVTVKKIGTKVELEMLDRSHTNITFRATLGYKREPGEPAPTGTVEFTEDGVPIPGCASLLVDARGTALCVAMAGSPAARHKVSATYSGDDAYTGSSATSNVNW